MKWLSINGAPRDGSPVICGFDCGPVVLVWKTNHRIVDAHKQGFHLDLSESYFGDPVESDDYGLAKEGPAYYLPYDPVPRGKK